MSIAKTIRVEIELVALESGLRGNELLWSEVLVDLKRHGLTQPPELAVGDGALGFWKALAKVYDNTRRTWCSYHVGSCTLG